MLLSGIENMDDNVSTLRLSGLREFLKYFAASAIALMVDYVIYWMIVKSYLMGLTGAATVGYMGGLVVAYFLISEKVFSDGWLKERRAYEVLLFFISGLLGIALTYISVAMYVVLFGESIHGAKLFAVAISFACVYLFRKFFVFRSVGT